ncbi:MAG: DUF655 domain-containing protein [archaeon]
MLTRKEEQAIILDFLPHGYPLEGRRMPVAQALGLNHFSLLELVPRKEVKLVLKEEVYIGPSKRDKIYFIRGKVEKQKLTETAKLQIKDIIPELVEKEEKKFVEFFNVASEISTRIHQFELLPGFGKKYTDVIIEEREKKPFSSFEDIRKRLKNVPDPKKVIEKRIIEELTEDVRHKLFVA